MRVVVPPLKEVRLLRGRPASLVVRPPRSAAARRGLAFERRVGRELRKLALPRLLVGPWLAFHDAAGPGLAQPDFLAWTRRGTPLLIEVKLGYSAEAWEQMDLLYLPLVQQIFGESAWTRIQICNVYAGQSVPSGTAGISTLRRVQDCAAEERALLRLL